MAAFNSTDSIQRADMNLVSIVIPAYNAAQHLEETINSALRQTWKNTEIIVVDDGSSDETPRVALKYGERGLLKVITQPNKGASAARNTGFLASKGDYIQFLDADDILEPNKISEQIKLATTHGDAVVFAGRWGLFYDNENNAVFKSNELWKNFTNPVDWLVTAWTNRMWMHPSAWLTPRHLIDKAGPWDESLTLHDDGEFFCRVLLRSKGTIFCNTAISYYRKGIDSSLSSIISEKAVASHFQICRLYEKHLLNVENTSRTRTACATNYLAFHYEHFPGHTSLRKKAIASAERLGGSSIEPTGTTLFLLAKKIVGWKLARRLEKFYYGHGLNRASIKKKFSQK